MLVEGQNTHCTEGKGCFSPSFPPQCTHTDELGGQANSMLVEGGFLFVGLRTDAGVGRIRAWHLQSGAQFTLDGHSVGGWVGVYVVAVGAEGGVGFKWAARPRLPTFGGCSVGARAGGRAGWWGAVESGF